LRGSFIFVINVVELFGKLIVMTKSRRFVLNNDSKMLHHTERANYMSEGYTFGREIITPDQRTDTVDRINSYMGVITGQTDFYTWYDDVHGIVYEASTRRGEFPELVDEAVKAVHPGAQPFVMDRQTAQQAYKFLEEVIE
jgi:hypothetical protein